MDKKDSVKTVQTNNFVGEGVAGPYRQATYFVSESEYVEDDESVAHTNKNSSEPGLQKQGTQMAIISKQSTLIEKGHNESMMSDANKKLFPESEQSFVIERANDENNPFLDDKSQFGSSAMSEIKRFDDVQSTTSTIMQGGRRSMT